MGLSLRRPPPRRMAMSVVSMIDVMMILLFFFMITSSYLNLDMVPALERSDAAPSAGGGPGATVLLRIAAGGGLTMAGQALTPEQATALLRDRLAADPMTQVLLFPSGAAPLQALVAAMDLVAESGAKRVKVIRIEAAP